MFNLFELKRLLSVRGKNDQLTSLKQNQSTLAALEDIDYGQCETDVDVQDDDQSPCIQCHAFTGPCRRPLVALSLSNSSLLIYAVKTQASDRPSVRTVPWFVHSPKQVVVLTFDPSGCWLLVGVRDATIFILPMFAFMSDEPLPKDALWSTKDLTIVRRSGRMAVPTAILWWRTVRAKHIAIIGNELGEISFFDLELCKEVGGTYITVAVSGMQLISDDGNGHVYLLITGSNHVQWQLTLEQSDGSYQFPLDGIKKGKPISPKGPAMPSSILSCLPTVGDRLPRSSSSNLSNESINGVVYPNRLVQFSGHTVLRSTERFRGKKYVFGFRTSKDVLALHHANLNQVPSYFFSLPPSTRHAVLGDHLLFVITHGDLTVLSADLSSSSTDVQRSYDPAFELQSFRLTGCGEILQLARCRVASAGCASRFGCLLITKRGLYCLQQRISTENLFLNLVLQEGCFTIAERAAKLLGADVDVLYEKAAEVKLAEGHVGSAVRLFQMAKCSYIRTVANFAAFGFLSEVLSYVRVLFSKPTFDISQVDLKHFSNLALYCYVQQCLEQTGESADLTRRHFGEFLKENVHYDEIVALHLLATYGLYDLLILLAERRGLIPQALIELLPPPNEDVSGDNGSRLLAPAWTDAVTSSRLVDRGFGDLISLKDDASFISCLLRPCLPSFFGLDVTIARRHLNYVRCLTVDNYEVDVDSLESLIHIYNPSNPAYAPLLNLSASINRPHTLPVEVGNGDSDFDATDYSQDAIEFTKQMTEFFLKLLLLLNNKKRCGASVTFNPDLVCRRKQSDNADSMKCAKKESSISSRSPPLAAGFAHSCVVVDGKLYTWGRNSNGCLGRGPARREWLIVDCIPAIRPPLIRALSVACGAKHTLVNTDCGLFAFGSNGYGQLGLDEACDQTCHPLLVKSLSVDRRVVAIACGQYHSLALSSDDAVYSFGWGVHGQLGHGHPYNLHTPGVIKKFISESTRIVSVSAGYAHSLFLSANGEVFACGCGQFGQLGAPQTSKSSLPVKLQLPETVRLVAAGFVHNVAVTTSGKILKWGCNPQTLRLMAQVARRNRASTGRSSSDGPVSMPSDTTRPPDSSELYDPETIPGIFSPAPLEVDALDSDVVQLMCGSNHTVMVTRAGRVYSAGRNLDGQCGHDDRRERVQLSRIASLDSRKVVAVACGADFTLVLDESGEISGFGVDDFGQIGGAVKSNSSSVEMPPANNPSKTRLLRTNKRVLILKQPTRNSIQQPTFLNLIPRTASSKLYCNEESYKRPIHSSLDHVHFTPATDSTVHFALEKLHGMYNTLTMEELCLSLGNYQAAAKVALLDGDVRRSFALNLRAISVFGSDSPSIELYDYCLSLVTVYLETIVRNDAATLKSLLEAVIGFWVATSGPIQQLEGYFTSHLTQLLFPIAAVIYGDSGSKDNDSESSNCISNRLSSQFHIKVVSEIINAFKNGNIDSVAAELLAETLNTSLLDNLRFSSSAKASDGEKPTKRLWDELIHNLLSNTNSDVTSAIDLSSLQVLNFLQDVGSGSTEIVLFTCGHHYSKEEFQTKILPHVEEALSEANVSPENLRTVVAGYEAMDFQFTACPRCLLDGYRQESVK